MKTVMVGWVAVLGLLMSAPEVAAEPRAAGRARMDREVAAAHDADRPSRVLIQYRAGSSAALRQRLRQRGITPKADHRGVGALSVTLGAGELRRSSWR